VSRPRPGLLTVAVLAPTVVLTALRGAVPGLQPALERDPDGLRAGELWRLLSPVLVQPDPPWIRVAVFALVGAVGLVAERVFSRSGWLAFAVLDTALGDIHGAPLLAGALLGLVLARDLPPPDTLSR
jgi:hypothetical protein